MQFYSRPRRRLLLPSYMPDTVENDPIQYRRALESVVSFVVFSITTCSRVSFLVLFPPILRLMDPFHWA